jgi:hypothetical protein
MFVSLNCEMVEAYNNPAGEIVTCKHGRGVCASPFVAPIIVWRSDETWLPEWSGNLGGGVRARFFPSDERESRAKFEWEFSKNGL